MIRYSMFCNESCVAQAHQDIYSHQDKNNIKHQYKRYKHFQQELAKFGKTIQALFEPLFQMRAVIFDKIHHFTQELKKIQYSISQRIETIITRIDKDSVMSKGHFSEKVIQKYEKYSCKQMSQLINRTKMNFLRQSMIQKQVKSQKQNLSKMYQNLISQKLNILSLIQSKKQEQISLYFSVDQSAIHNVENNVDLEDESILNQLKFRSKSSQQKQNRRIIFEKRFEEEEIIEEDQNDISFYHSQNKSSKNELPLSQLMPEKKQSIVQLKSKRSIKTNVTLIQSDCQDDKESYEQNQQQLSRSILKIQESISNYKDNQSVEKFYTVQELLKLYDNIEEQGNLDLIKFNTKVKIIKLLYFPILHHYIPKVKFIAGDHTGIAVFFTNYFKDIKVGTEIQMHNCIFFNFRQSIEIVNNVNFKIIKQAQASIDVVNRLGVIFNNNITKDLRYSVPDRNCALVSQIADKLRTKNKFIVHKMVVRISFVLNEWENKIFCQIGDSSGRMLAYLKKPLQPLKQGDVVKIMKAYAIRGLQPNNFMAGQIFYLDTLLDKGSKVTLHKYEFLDISDDIMNIEG